MFFHVPSIGMEAVSNLRLADPELIRARMVAFRFVQHFLNLASLLGFDDTGPDRKAKP
jgi:hypothetical protein